MRKTKAQRIDLTKLTKAIASQRVLIQTRILRTVIIYSLIAATESRMQSQRMQLEAIRRL